MAQWKSYPVQFFGVAHTHARHAWPRLKYLSAGRSSATLERYVPGSKIPVGLSCNLHDRACDDQGIS
jgi:hypothetical protein